MISKNAALILTYNCKNYCIFCKPTKKKFTNDFQKVKTDAIIQINNLKKRGFTKLEISGHDPIEYPEIVKLVKYVKKKGFKNVTLTTHGRNLSDVSLVKGLKDAGIDRLQIPLYGSNEKIHDSITRAKGSFKETLKGIENIKKYIPNATLRIHTLIMKQNYKDMLDILLLASKYTKRFTLTLPCIAFKEMGKKYFISFDKMRPYLRALIHISDKKGMDTIFRDVPFCIFGLYRKYMLNKEDCPETADNYTRPPEARTKSNIASYRVKTKLKVCSRCKLNKLCDGVYKNYLEFVNLDNFKPLK